MHYTRWLATAIFLSLALASCDVSMGGFEVPPQVWTGQVFEVVVRAGAGSQPGAIGAILQLPSGFSVEGAVGTGEGSSAIVVPGGGQSNMAPTLVAAEAGHSLIGFSGSAQLGLFTPSGATLKVYVRAPATTGAFTLKVALWGTNGVLPAGTTSFATITTAPHARPISVVGSPVTPFFAAPIQLASTLPTRLHGIALGDLDSDGLDDVASCVADPPFAYSTSTGGLPAGTYVWKSGGTAPWQPVHPPSGPAGASNLHVAFGDFDGDGHLDLAESTGRVLFGDGGVSWTLGPALPLMLPDWAGVATGDVDGDGRDDVVFGAWTTDAVQVFRSGPNRTFADWSTGLPNGTNGPAGSDHLALVDFSGDGHRDLVASGGIGLRAWTGDGMGHWQPASSGLPLANAFGLGDFDANGDLDLVVSPTPAPVAVYVFSAGLWQQRTMPTTNTTTVGGMRLVVLDYDRDGWPDVVVAHGFYFGSIPLFSTLLLYRNQGGQSFSAPMPLTAMLPIDGIADLAVGDVDGDTWPDFVAAIPGEPPIVWHNTGSGLSSFGAACSAVGFSTPATSGIGQPQIGNVTFAIELQSASSNSLGLIWIGLSNRYAFGAPILPYDLALHGAPGCAVVASSEAVFFVVADNQGRATVPLPIPNDPALRRLTLFAQSAASAPVANALGWLFANGLAVKIP